MHVRDRPTPITYGLHSPHYCCRPLSLVVRIEPGRLRPHVIVLLGPLVASISVSVL